ncbi:MAG: Mov34/MPN/PAD-1 family protein [Verrucomicrobiota bacterium]
MKRGADPRSNITMRAAAPTENPHRRNFPGPRGAQSQLRVAIERSAHAELIAHAKESLDAEICGVLGGRVCEDDEGAFVHVEAAIRGTAANQGSTHVTFTHATWNAIHQTMERDHPQLRIVGWYHSHPGFGVEFSEMDVFIQKNFFSSPTQIALVIDPLNGNVAVCINTPRGIEYLPRYWVDGREHEGKTPALPAARTEDRSEPKPVSVDGDRKLQTVEERVGQLVLAVDDLRASLYRFLLFIGGLAALAILVVAGYAIFYQMKERVEPPKNIGFAPVPVQIGTNTALLGVQIVKWDLPPELDVMRQAVDQLRRELEQAASPMLTNAPGPSVTNGVPPNKSTP